MFLALVYFQFFAQVFRQLVISCIGFMAGVASTTSGCVYLKRHTFRVNIREVFLVGYFDILDLLCKLTGLFSGLAA